MKDKLKKSAGAVGKWLNKEPDQKLYKIAGIVVAILLVLGLLWMVLR